MTNSVVTKRPRDLSDPGKALYRKIINQHRQMSVSNLNDEEKETLQELVEAGISSVSYGTIYAKLISKDFTVAHGRGIYRNAYRIDIYDATQDRTGYHNILLAQVIGTDFNIGDGSHGWKEAIIDCRHLTATDIEHDASKVFTMTLLNPNMVRMVAGRSEFTATAVEGHWYDFGVDPLTVDGDYDYTEMEPCDNPHCDGHSFAPYLPPERKEFPRLVRLEVTPLTAEDEG